MKRCYQIEIRGYGGEYCLGAVTKEQYEFWTNNELMSILKGFDSAEEAFTDYIVEVGCSDPDDGIPEEARFEYSWYDHDEVYHLYGANIHNAWILIHEVVKDKEIEVLNEEVSKLVENSNSELKCSDYDWPEDAEYLLESISSEKGTFFQCTLEIDHPIDLNRFTIHTQESWNEEEIIVGIDYASEDLENDGGDTNGKGYFFTLHNVA